MKPFNLEEALSGKPVRLRCGSKAYVLGDLRDLFPESKEVRCLIGIDSEREHSKQYSSMMRWKCTGSYYEHIYESEYDITGMWEEPAKPQSKILEEAWQNKGRVTKTDAGMTTTVEVVGKTSDGEYIVRNPVDGLLAHIDAYGKLNWRPYEEPKSPVLNHNLVILHLPKPIGPREGENYWYISKKPTGELYAEHGRYSHSLAADRTRREQSNCFSSELDAQAWIDALNYARTGKVKIE